jgi:ABC-type lipoprotein release transport system permease subunit
MTDADRAHMRGGWLWARSDMRRRWLSLAVVALFIAFAAGTTMALVAGAQRAGSATERFESATDVSEVLAFVGYDPSDSSGAAHEGVLARLVAALDSDPDVTRHERSDIVGIAPDPVTPGFLGITAVGHAGGSPGIFGRPLLLAGRYPDAADEMLVNERAATLFDLRVGERRQLLAIACFGCEPELLDAEVTITGIVRLGNDLVEDPSETGMFLAHSSFLEGAWTDYARPGTIVAIHLVGGADGVVVSQRLSPLVGNGNIRALTTASLVVSERAGELQRSALLIAAATIGMIGLVVTAQAMGRHMSVRRDDEQILLGLGLDRSQRMAAVGCVLAPAVIVGAVGAVPVTVALSPLLPLGLSRRADPDIGLHLDLVVVGVGVLATLAGGALVVAFVARQWLQRPAQPPSQASSVIAGFAGLGVRPVPLTGIRFALDRGPNSRRLPTRAMIAIGVLTIAVVSAAVVTRSSLDGLIRDPAAYGQNWQLRVDAGEGGASAIREKLATDPRVDAIDLFANGALDVVTGDGTVARLGTLGMQGVNGSTSLGMLSGRAPNGPGEIAFGSGSMRDLGVAVGDTVTVRAPCGQQPMTVVGRMILPLFGADNPDVGSVIALEGFEELCADQLTAAIDQQRGAAVRLHDDRDIEAFAADLDAQGIFYEPSSRPGSVTSLRDIADVPMIVAVIAALMGAAAIAYGLALTVRRRREDLAILRSLGLTSSQTGSVMTWQATVVAIVSIVLGLPIGIGLGRAVWSSVAGRSNLIVRPEVPTPVLFGLAIGALVVALAASAWPNRRARRLQPARVLRGE